MLTNVIWFDQLYYIIQNYKLDQSGDLCIFNFYTGGNYIQLTLNKMSYKMSASNKNDN